MTWQSPNEKDLNGVLVSYKVEIYKELINGHLGMIANHTVKHSVQQWSFSGLQKNTEYIMYVKAGTRMGFGPPTVVHQETSGDGRWI